MQTIKTLNFADFVTYRENQTYLHHQGVRNDDIMNEILEDSTTILPNSLNNFYDSESLDFDTGVETLHAHIFHV